jgi:hypothetical protein
VDVFKPEDFYSPQEHIDREGVHAYRKDTAQLAKHPLFLQPTIATTKTLIIIHGEDEDIPPETTDAYQQALNADTYTVKGFSHATRASSNPQEEMPGYFSAIRQWLVP